MEVPAIAMYEILEEINEPVRLLKLACEGSEFPILFTSQKLSMIKVIIGEYHNFSSINHIPASLRIENIENFTMPHLHDLLLKNGFKGRKFG